MSAKAIALIGFSGCGKTTIGKLLAKELGIPFSDLDDRTESFTGMRLSDILIRMGESGLRTVESLALSVLGVSGGIVATSSGSIMFLKNRRILEEGFFTIFLDAPFEALYPRIVGTARPLLYSLSESELSMLYSMRSELYKQSADIVVDATKNPEEIVNEVVGVLKIMQSRLKKT